MGIENPVHLLFIAAVALVVLGPKRLPELARSLGKGIREFRESISDGSATGAPHVPASQNPAPAAAPADATVVATPPVAPAAVSSTQNLPPATADAGATAPPPEPAAAAPIDPPEPVRSGDHAPDSRPL
jgi:TatA/E family protein of Tat protein translocase